MLDHGLNWKRYHHILNLEQLDDSVLKIACHDPTSNAWTKWQPFPYNLWDCTGWQTSYFSRFKWLYPIDAHRSLSTNEIVIESDYPEFEDNVAASRIIGGVLEHQGFQPMYYYSGNKSIHIHVYFDWTCLHSVDRLLADQVRNQYHGNRDIFRKDFIKWLRTMILDCWDMDLRDFDKDLIRANHLIRTELSRHRLGFKTFLGYSSKSLGPIPIVCNEENGVVPELGELRLSTPRDPQRLIEEFYQSLQEKDKKAKLKRMYSLTKWVDSGPEKLRPCVSQLMSKEFKEKKDGSKRAMFILANELKRIMGIETARILINDWNESIGGAVKREDIEYRLNQKNYTLTCAYIHGFLEEVGLKPTEKCRSKV